MLSLRYALAVAICLAAFPIISAGAETAGTGTAGWRATVRPSMPLAVIPPTTEMAGRARDPAWSFTLKRFHAAGGAAIIAAPALQPPRDSIMGPRHAMAGLASYYWQEQRTASGELFDKQQFTAAHRTLPFGTRVRVVDVRSGRAVVVRINDRGPFRAGRVIDLSLAAAKVLGMDGKGVAAVKIEVVEAK